jgi:dihydrofolate synthase / folylpolyglutamate synthase
VNIKAIKTKPIKNSEISLNDFLDTYINALLEGNIVVISSKVISLIEGRVSYDFNHKKELVKDEADYISREETDFGYKIVIKHSAFISAAGIDQSNGDGAMVLLPKDPMKISLEIYTYLKKKFNIEDLGVIITDSRSIPLRRGAIGVAIGFHGFRPLRDYVGTKDIFGRDFVCEKLNIVDSLAIAANLVMGEGSEQTPISVISDIENIEFNSNCPTKDEIQEFYLDLKEDFFGQFYKNIF